MLVAVSRHGYGRWQAVVDDKDLRIQEVICKELNLPFIKIPAAGAPQVQLAGSGAPPTPFTAAEVSHAHISDQGAQEQNGVNKSSAETLTNQVKEASTGNDNGSGVAHGMSDSGNHAQFSQDSSILYHFREMQRRQVEFIKKRVLLLEKALNAEYQKEIFVSSFTCYNYFIFIHCLVQFLFSGNFKFQYFIGVLKRFLATRNKNDF